MAQAAWTLHSAPRQDGRVAVVTGANSGIGYQAARMLAELGAETVLACRSAERGQAALERLRGAVPQAQVSLAALDLADLGSVRAFAETAPDRIDLLVNNAGVMALPFRTTADGFEMQFGTNHLGHFALTCLLLPRLLAAPEPRVTTVSSELHRGARRVTTAVPDARRYRRWPAYFNSKLANLLFTAELQRRADEAGAGLLSMAAHPGMAATELASTGPAMEGRTRTASLLRQATSLTGQSDVGGALPTVRATVDPALRGGAYIGPGGLFGMSGAPRPCSRSAAARDTSAARRLWTESARLTGADADWTQP